MAEILAELSNLNPPHCEFNTKSIKKALALFDNPQLKLYSIHIAGTNGKGSTAAFIEEGLYQAAYKVGKFTSPFIHQINECISLNKKMITDEELAFLYLDVKVKLSSEKLLLSSFEMLTLIMFIYFTNQKIDFLVLETGMGGLNDATNVVESHFSIITNIDLEHTQWLGSSLKEIAEHKAGIIKKGKTIIADNTPELIQAVLQKTKHFIHIQSKYQIRTHLDFITGMTHLSFSSYNSDSVHHVELGLLGHFQAYNFLCAFEVLHTLSIPLSTIFSAARSTRWPGRLYKIQDSPCVFIDASHNELGVKNIYHSLKENIKKEASIIICSILKDKNQKAMLEWYSQIADHIIFCEVENQDRVESAEHIAFIAKDLFKKIQIIKNPIDALKKSLSKNKEFILISGSSYLIRYFLKKKENV